jgi:hypothetical protein
MMGAESPDLTSPADLGGAEHDAVEAQPAIPSQFTVKVGGEEMQVSLEEALNGYQRQADYTRKTQELAAEREQLTHAERLWNAIEQNPEYVIREMAQAYGVPVGQQPQQTAKADDDDPFAWDDDEPSLSDPKDPRWQQVEQFMAQAQMERAQAQIDRELAGLHQTYGVNFNDTELLQFAVERQIADLDAAFKAFAFDRMTRAATDRSVQQRKAQAPPVAGGHGVAAGAVAPGVASASMSVADAFRAAEAAHGIG